MISEHSLFRRSYALSHYLPEPPPPNDIQEQDCNFEISAIIRSLFQTIAEHQKSERDQINLHQSEEIHAASITLKTGVSIPKSHILLYYDKQKQVQLIQNLDASVMQFFGFKLSANHPHAWLNQQEGPFYSASTIEHVIALAKAYQKKSAPPSLFDYSKEKADAILEELHSLMVHYDLNVLLEQDCTCYIAIQINRDARQAYRYAQWAFHPEKQFLQIQSNWVLICSIQKPHDWQNLVKQLNFASQRKLNILLNDLFTPRFVRSLKEHLIPFCHNWLTLLQELGSLAYMQIPFDIMTAVESSNKEKEEILLLSIFYRMRVGEIESSDIAKLEALVQHHPKQALTRICLAKHQEDKGLYDLPLQLLSLVIQDNPHHALAFYQRAKLNVLHNKTESALSDLEQALKIKPQHPMALGLRGSIKQELSQFDEALTDLLQATALEDQDSNLFFQLGAYYLKNHDFNPAIRYLSLALQLNDTHLQALFFRGLSYFYQDPPDLSAAEKDINKKVGLEPKASDLEVLSEIYVAQGQRDSALKALNQAIDLEDKNPTYWSKRAKVFADQEKYSLALDDLKQAIQINPNCIDAYLQRAQLYHILKRQEEAEKDLQTAEILVKLVRSTEEK